MRSVETDIDSKIEALRQRLRALREDDPESAHIADAILLEALDLLGYGELVDEYMSTRIRRQAGRL